MPDTQTTSKQPRDFARVRAEVRDLYDDYACCLDDGELEAWPDFFTEDATYIVTSLENYSQGLDLSVIYCKGIAMLRDRVLAIQEAMVHEPRALRHLVSCVRVNGVDGETIRSQANFAVFECLMDQEPHVLMTGRYVDTIMRRGSTLRFLERKCIYDNYRIRTSFVMPV